MDYFIWLNKNYYYYNKLEIYIHFTFEIYRHKMNLEKRISHAGTTRVPFQMKHTRAINASEATFRISESYKCNFVEDISVIERWFIFYARLRENIHKLW